MSEAKRNCFVCEKEFFALEVEIKRGNGKFCSLSCSSSRPRKQKTPNVSCAFCGKRFYKRPSALLKSKSGLYFCCREHKDLAQRIDSGIDEINPPHYGEVTANYRKTAFSYYPEKCNRCGWDVHPEVLIVHHKDRDRKNNHVENLEVFCQNCHAWEHYQAGDGAYSFRKI